MMKPKEIQLSAPEEPKLIILLWTWPFGMQFPLNKCPNNFDASGCFYTDNRSLFTSANVVIIHHRDVCSSRNLLPPILRPPGQYWVWFNMESPTHSPNLDFMDNLINLTMSYRSDSDIFNPYGYLEENKSNNNFTIPEKSQLVCWAISNWNPDSKRVQYYEELKKYIPITVYGQQHIPIDGESLIKTISKYKFYLTFENSLHKDYITEKLWHNALTSGTVPIVLGPPRENYERFLPPESFIHVEDFPSAMELATYLLELDKDNQRYQQYFRWRSKLQPVRSTSVLKSFCMACKAFKKAPPYRTLPSLSSWFQ
ncbi:3-galactosyl-N-acetylglucosaminide 4-alpha-L-fucosyltransferase FUT3-like [Bombina bombina]|uniref:3-galactosyl-N-acetylglucosaminide 4-alpha-L-fucosyltransferase FUT3-like n=1 Tax=Bombina bombina TaxID=8345 RepID=UPI00235AB4D0|nr:3-galactosyl-N-acetylglucosaminide 4-alpha-L-fucosyltransferase FUT3-like [Bombina bombina]